MPITCPRCGETGYLEKQQIGTNTYYYCSHISYENGKRRVRKCYLGPKSYIYVSKMHDFSLHGLTELTRYIEYLGSIAETLVERQQFSQLKEFLPELIRAKRELDALIAHLQVVLEKTVGNNQITAGDEISLENFAQFLRKKKNKEKTVKGKVAVVKSFLASTSIPLPRIGREEVVSFLQTSNYKDKEKVKRVLREFFEFLGRKEIVNLLSS